MKINLLNLFTDLFIENDNHSFYNHNDFKYKSIISSKYKSYIY